MHAFLRLLRVDVCNWMASSFDRYLKDMYLVRHDGNKPLPSLRAAKRCSIDALAVWAILQKAAGTGASVATTTAILAEEDWAGTTDRASCWMAKSHLIYYNRRISAFRNSNHFSLVCDPGRQSTQDMLLSTVWSWESQSAAYGDLQSLPEQSIVLPSESHLPPFVMEMKRKEKQVRVSAFRELQAISHVISELTEGHIAGIWEFMPPAKFQWKPVGPNETRVVLPQGSQNMAVIRKEEAHATVRVVPSSFASAQRVKLLVLGLDQGSTGTAGVIFSGDHLGAMLLPKFDKYHRCIRDLKLSLTHCCRGLFMKTQLYTSFLWGLHYKPSGTGSFGTQKKHVLNVFLATEDYMSTVFEKYGERIAQHTQVKLHHGITADSIIGNALNWDTPADRQHIFEQIGELV